MRITGNMADSRIYVCQSGTCRSRGSDAALVEIEELAKLVGGCEVDTTGCLGYCSQGPACMVVQRSSGGRPRRRFLVKVNTFARSAAVVRGATGRQPPDEDDLPPETESRLAGIRAAKRREYFVSTYQWNKALAGVDESSVRRMDLLPAFEGILGNAGYRFPVSELLNPGRALGMPTSIKNYTPWALESVEVVSGHSAIFSFATRDAKRGTPHPRGRGRLADPITWHVTMLGEVGANEEGPLPWIERDYTPISSALEWERGKCRILIKIYRDGILTSWLQQRTSRIDDSTRIWLSKPIRTLSVPSLVADDDDGFRPKSILLLLAGTGIVALPQILAHREPHRFLGIPTPRYKQLKCPIDLIQSCREDDMLLLPQIRQYCLDAMKPHRDVQGVRNYTLLLTGERRRDDGEGAPYQGRIDEDGLPDCDAGLKGVPNARALRTRLTAGIVEDAIGRMARPFRVVVSGPDTFNSAAREYLDECGVDSSHVTLLSA